MAGYSQDLRERVIWLRNNGETLRHIAEVLNISMSSVKRYLNRYKTTGSVRATVARRMQPMLGATDLAVLEGQLRAHNDWTLAQHLAGFTAQTGRTVSVSTLGRAVMRLGWTRKKRQWVQQSETLGHDAPLANG